MTPSPLLSKPPPRLWSLLLPAATLFPSIGFAELAPASDPAPVYSAKNFKTVVIDPGHGGLDSGTIWYGVSEEDLTLDLAKRLERELTGNGLKAVVMTRTEDVSISLMERVKFAEKYPKPILVSLHFDAMPDKSAHGCKVFVSPHAQTATKFLARSVVEQLRTLEKPVCRGVKLQNFLLLRESSFPSIIIEGGFMSNPTESKLLQTEAFRARLAKALAEGILAYGNQDLTVVDEAAPESLTADSPPP